MARELTNDEEGFLTAPVPRVLMDRDTKFSAQFQAILKDAGAKPVLLPASSPTLKDEAISRIILFSEKALRTATKEFLAHYHAERNHQGLEHKVIEPRRGSGHCRRRDRVPRAARRAAEVLSPAGRLSCRALCFLVSRGYSARIHRKPAAVGIARRSRAIRLGRDLLSVPPLHAGFLQVFKSADFFDHTGLPLYPRPRNSYTARFPGTCINTNAPCAPRSGHCSSRNFPGKFIRQAQSDSCFSC